MPIKPVALSREGMLRTLHGTFVFLLEISSDYHGVALPPEYGTLDIRALAIAFAETALPGGGCGKMCHEVASLDQEEDWHSCIEWLRRHVQTLETSDDEMLETALHVAYLLHMYFVYVRQRHGQKDYENAMFGWGRGLLRKFIRKPLLET